jgi:transposase InsO family protein
VKRLCTVLKIARSSFYYWRATAPAPAPAPARAAGDAADAALAVRIRAVQKANDGTYGAPRISAELHDGGLAVNHKKVVRVMRRHRIAGLRLRRRVQTTIADPAPAKAADLIGRDFTAVTVNERYVGDITYLPVGERGFPLPGNSYRSALTTSGRLRDRRSHAH